MAKMFRGRPDRERNIRERKRHPAEMGAPEISAFPTHLATKQSVSASTQNQALCALSLTPSRRHLQIGDSVDHRLRTDLEAGC